MTNYYSQNGEDFLLDQLFKDKEIGFFIEVGSLDGRRFSNTLTFEERGWRGLCIEAHEGYIKQLRSNRPNSIICHCAVGECDDDEVVFYANSRGSLSTLDETKENDFKKHGQYFTGFEEQIVQKRTLSTLLNKYEAHDIDILSLDIEGYEVEALMGLDLQMHKPLVFVIESESREHEYQLDNLLFPVGYSKSIRLEQNIFYLLNPSMDAKIRNLESKITLIHTRHPLDQGEDRFVEIEINTHENDLGIKFKNLSNMAKKAMRFVYGIFNETPRQTSEKFTAKKRKKEDGY